MKPDPVWEHSARCPACDALNDLDARWCGLCFARLAEEVPSGKHEDVTVDGRRPRPVDTRVSTRDDDQSLEGLGSLLGTWDGKPVWRCARCFERNPLSADVCAECGLDYKESAHRIAERGLSTQLAATDRTALGVVGFGARVMMLIGGLLAPVVFVAMVLSEIVRRILRGPARSR